jgi:hypothetical protein
MISICSVLGEELGLEILDMKSREVLDFSNELQLLKSKKTFEKKKIQFNETFNLPREFVMKTVHCGKEFWNQLDRNKGEFGKE